MRRALSLPRRRFNATLPVRPMEFAARPEIPDGDWIFEPKWDGFRCLLVRDGRRVTMRSKAGQPLERYFPEIVDGALALPDKRFMLDGEIVMRDRKHTFDDLLQRIHPAASRVRALAKATPAILIAFDLLGSEDAPDAMARSLRERRPLLVAFMERNARGHAVVRLSPSTTRRSIAQRWLDRPKAAMDGIIAKDPERAYEADSRTGGVKIKRVRTVDCVVGGFRWSSKGGTVGSLLLGLYADGKLDHVGFTSSFDEEERRALVRRLRPLVKPPGFTGKAPGGPSRWSTKRSAEWVPLDPVLVVEVAFDRVTGERIRHGARFVRWRPDKQPRRCTMDQLKNPR